MTAEELNIADELKRLSRRLDTLQKSTDLLFKDREILEDVLTRLTALENAMNLQRQTATENAKNMRNDISGVKEAVEAKVEEVTEHMDDKTVIVKAPHDTILQKIINKLKGK